MTADTAPAPSDATPLFDLVGVTFQVGGRTPLGPLDLRVSGGRVTAVIGHNGSGKSTLAKILGRQHAPSAGTVLYAGQDVGTWSTRAFARKVAYMAQENPPASGMLVRELVALGRYPWLGALGRAGPGDRTAIAAAMAATGVAGLADRFVESLSGGERQRAFMAVMLAQEAQCLILDEPISALDVSHQVGVLSLLRRLAHDRGLSVVIVLHDVNMAARFCDDILALHSGREIARGSPDTIMTPEILHRIYDTQFGTFRHPDTEHLTAYVR